MSLKNLKNGVKSNERSFEEKKEHKHTRNMTRYHFASFSTDLLPNEMKKNKRNDLNNKERNLGWHQTKFFGFPTTRMYTKTPEQAYRMFVVLFLFFSSFFDKIKVISFRQE